MNKKQIIFYVKAISDFYEGVWKKNWYRDNWENEFYDDRGWHGLSPHAGAGSNRGRIIPGCTTKFRFNKKKAIHL
jgi:hypothetical protein